MELTKLIMKNFRAHKALSLNLAQGITGIIGGNGTGKSSIVEAIMFLLTGEGYGKTKNEMLTVGEVSGYVIGHLSIDGKEAVLERHIDTAKVNLKYDGKVYKKSSEVSELWGNLFQIDKHIVKNIVISNQGEIALLLNGDASTKEKLFQKIFMVPNTSKLRDIIWNNYIKAAPPEYPVKDSSELRSEVHILKKLIEEEELELAAVHVDEGAYDKLIARKSFLTQVVNSAMLLAKYDALIPRLELDITELRAEKAGINNKTAHIDIATYIQKLQALDASKPLYESKQLVLVKKKTLIPPGKILDQKAYDEANHKHSELETKLASLNLVTREFRTKIADYESKGIASGVCPTCGTSLENLLDVVAHIKSDLAIREKEIAGVSQELMSAKNDYENLSKLKIAWELYHTELKSLDDKLEAYENIDYSEEDHNLYKSVVSQYDLYAAEVRKIDARLASLETELNSAKLSLAGITQYDRDRSEFDGEQAEIDAQIIKFKEAQAKATAIKVSIGAKTKELEALLKQVDENNRYIEKNARRKKYVGILNSLYDLFHTSKFPRALIQTYASTVSEYMTEILASFEFPYTAKVNESFGINIYDSEDRELPSISGGQQVMVGFSLRMALHQMFVGAFPFMIIDEGSYGLAEDSIKKYFNIISKLNKTSKFKQVIVIDHHKELSDYVDHTILLT
jgi:DNA repair exonuclease SbcCD ATPase subunit